MSENLSFGEWKWKKIEKECGDRFQSNFTEEINIFALGNRKKSLNSPLIKEVTRELSQEDKVAKSVDNEDEGENECREKQECH